MKLAGLAFLQKRQGVIERKEIPRSRSKRDTSVKEGHLQANKHIS